MTRSSKPRPVPGSRPVGDRLQAFLDRRPDAIRRFTLSDLAREIGVSRQTTWKLLPSWAEDRQRLDTAKVRAFARKHPGARLSDLNHRLTWRRMAAETALPLPTVQRIWASLRLPAEDVDRAVFIRKRADRQRRRLATVLRTETCELCGVTFPWTMHHERARKYVGRWLTCSRSCAQRLRHARAARR